MSSILLAQVMDVPIRGVPWFMILLVLGVGFWLGSRQRQRSEIPRGVSLARTIIGGVFAILVSIALIAAFTVTAVFSYRSQGVQQATLVMDDEALPGPALGREIAERVQQQVQSNLELHGIHPPLKSIASESFFASEAPVSALEVASIPPAIPSTPPAPPPQTAPPASVATAAAPTAQPTESGRPAWIKTTIENHGDVTSLVVSSQQFATQGEAAQQADQQVREFLEKDFSKRTEGIGFGPRTLSVSPAVVQSTIRDRYVEVTERDFGTFTAPMYRMWYRVELSPTVRSQMLAVWQTELKANRMIASLIGFGALLLIPLTVLGYGRVIRWAASRGKQALYSGVFAAVGSTLMLMMFGLTRSF